MKQTKEAVNQQLTIDTAQVGAFVAAFLVPNYNDGQQLAIVDEGVLKYLKSLLPKANVNEIVEELINRIKEHRYSANSTEHLKNVVNECQDFVAFHTSINLMKKYFDPNVKVERAEPFNATPREMTITEMIEHYNVMSEELAKLDVKIKAHPDYPTKQSVEVVESPR